MTTSQYDNFRTGATLSETILSPATVNAAQFGRLGAFRVDGAVYAQPLFLSALRTSAGTRDVVFAATEHDSVYAFDAVQPAAPPLWYRSFLDSSHGVTTVPASALHCPFIRPEVGITSTPVIDASSGTLFVLARTKRGDLFEQHLHALDVATGAEKTGSPVLITASVPGNGVGASGGHVAFDPLRENPRAALLLVKGQVILSWASSCDVGPYHGWLMAYDARTLHQTAVINLTADGGEGGIWASDTGLAADDSGTLYVSTGNGTFDVHKGGKDYGDSVVALALAPGGFVVHDTFTPHIQDTLNGEDLDLGSSGPTLIPARPGAPSRLLQPAKGGTVYVLDPAHLGGFHSDRDDIVQEISLRHGGYGAMAYWNGHAYFAASDDALRDYRVTGGRLEPAAASIAHFANPGATPTVSSDRTANAVVWAIATKTWNGPEQPAVLYAFDAGDISKPIYTSEQNGARDGAALATRFVIPVVANGRVYFGARGEVDVYGLLR